MADVATALAMAMVLMPMVPCAASMACGTAAWGKLRLNPGRDPAAAQHMQGGVKHTRRTRMFLRSSIVAMLNMKPAGSAGAG